MGEPRKGPINERLENIKKTTYSISEEREVDGPTIVKRELKNQTTAYALVIKGQMIPVTEEYIRELKQVLDKACPGPKLITTDNVN